MKTLNAIIEQSSDGNFSIYHNANELNYLITGTGKTIKQAKKDFLSGYEDIRYHCIKNGEEFEDINWHWSYDTSTFLREYAFAFSLAGLSRITGVSQGILSHYVNGTSHPSPKTLARIQRSISEFAKDLSEVHFI